MITDGGKFETSNTSPASYPAVKLDGEVDWQTESDRKPPYSYATLIYLTIKHHGGGKVTLSQVYEWILKNFAYYRRADPGWKNSIRHNLTQHSCFIKIPRSTGEPGKGGFWALDPAYVEVFESGTFKGTSRRAASRKRLNPPSEQQAQAVAVSKASDKATTEATAAAQMSPQCATKQNLASFDASLNHTSSPFHRASISAKPLAPRKDVLRSRDNFDTSATRPGMMKRRRIEPEIPELRGLLAEQSENVFDYRFLEEFCNSSSTAIAENSTNVMDGIVAWPTDDIQAPSLAHDRFRTEVQQERYGMLEQQQLFDFSLGTFDIDLWQPESLMLGSIATDSRTVSPVSLSAS